LAAGCASQFDSVSRRDREDAPEGVGQVLQGVVVLRHALPWLSVVQQARTECDEQNMQSAPAQKILLQILQSVKGTDEYIDLVTRYEVKSENNNLLQLALDKPNEQIGKNAAGLLLNFKGINLIEKIINGSDTVQQQKIIKALSGVGNEVSINMLQNIFLSKKYPEPIKKMAATAIGKSNSGEDRVLVLLKNKKVPSSLIPDVVAGVKGAWRQSIRKQAEQYLPEDQKNITAAKAPSLQNILSLKANAGDGFKVFTNTCSVCHKANETGYDFGPRLTEIGSKLPKESLYEAIIHPSAGISFGYEGWEIKMKDGSEITGIISSKTETDIDVKFPGGGTKHIKTSEVKSLNQMKTSMMTEGLYANMSAQDIANLLEFLEQLKKK